MVLRSVRASFHCRRSSYTPTSCQTTACASQLYTIRGISFVCRMSIQNLNTFGEYGIRHFIGLVLVYPRPSLSLSSLSPSPPYHPPALPNFPLLSLLLSFFLIYSSLHSSRTRTTTTARHRCFAIKMAVVTVLRLHGPCVIARNPTTMMAFRFSFPQTPLQMQSRVQTMTSRTALCI